MRLVLALAALTAAAQGATTYYVSPSGNNTAGTSPTTAFTTIQKAANVMAAGDTCYIMAGTYRETVRPTNSGTAALPMHFTRYGSDYVEINGCDLLPSMGWTVYSGSIYKVSFSSTVSEMFVGDLRVPKACYPNEPSNPYDIGSWMDISMAAGQTGQFYGRNFSSGYWSGATIIGLVGSQWVTNCGTISSSSGSSYTATTASAEWATGSAAYVGDGKGFITNHLNALDSPGEWHQQSGVLYLWARNSQSPAAQKVEARVRTYAFDLNARNYIQVDGLNVKAAKLNLRNAQNCTVSNCTVRFVAPFQYHSAGFNRDAASPDQWEYTGIEISGSGNMLRDSYIAESWGDGVTVWGTGNTVQNCLIENTDRSLTDAASISVTGTGHVVKNNTLRASGRSIVVHRYLQQGHITLNNLYEAGLATGDLGLTYCFQTDGAGTEISYNWAHDNRAIHTAFGIYLDNGSNHHLVHHNVVWNCETGLQVNSPSDTANVFNNTFWNVTNAAVNGFISTYGNALNVQMSNNLSQAGPLFGQTMSNNIQYGDTPPFADVKNYDFRLAPATTAVDAGLVISGITDGYNGSAPDVGAYELNVTWTPGSTISAPSFSDLRPVNPDRLRAVQGGLQQNLLTWRDCSANETGFCVYRQDESGGAFTLLATLPANTTSYLDTTAVSDASYTYRITAINAAGESAGTSREIVRTLTAGDKLMLEAENYDAAQGVTNFGSGIGSCDNGDWIKFSGLDLRARFGIIRARLAVPADTAGHSVEVHLDSATGTLLGTLVTTSTGSWDTYVEQTAALTTPTSGIHDLYFVFKGGSGVGNFDWFQLEGGTMVGTPYVRTYEFEAASAYQGSTPTARGFGSDDDGDWIRFNQVDLGLGAKSIDVLLAVPASNQGRFIDIRADSVTGPLLGTLTTVSTGSWDTYRPQHVALSSLSGIHDLYFMFRGGSGVANVDSFDLTLMSPPAGNVATTIQAESANAISGASSFGTGIGSFDNGDWVRFDNVYFGLTGSRMDLRLAVPDTYAGQTIEFRLDAPNGQLIGVHHPVSTGSWSTYQTQTALLSAVGGTHSLYLVARGGSGVANLDWLEIEAQGAYTFQAENCDAQSGLTVSGGVIGSCDNGDWVRYNDVWFGAQTSKVAMNLAVPATNAGQTIEIRVDSLTGPVIGNLVSTSTGSWTSYTDQTANITPTSGLHDLYLIFRGTTGVANVNSISLE